MQFLLGKSRLRQEPHELMHQPNIMMDLREIEWCGMDWINLVQNRDQWGALVNTVMNLWVPYNAIKFLSS
jgi:hypothetical protein